MKYKKRRIAAALVSLKKPKDGLRLTPRAD
jgi:hypothetical protein